MAEIERQPTVGSKQYFKSVAMMRKNLWTTISETNHIFEVVVMMQLFFYYTKAILSRVK